MIIALNGQGKKKTFTTVTERYCPRGCACIQCDANQTNEQFVYILLLTLTYWLT